MHGVLGVRRDASNNVTRRFFPQGEQIAGLRYFFSRDHLGSVRQAARGRSLSFTQFWAAAVGRRRFGTDVREPKQRLSAIHCEAIVVSGSTPENAGSGIRSESVDSEPPDVSANLASTHRFHHFTAFAAYLHLFSHFVRDIRRFASRETKYESQESDEPKQRTAQYLPREGRRVARMNSEANRAAESGESGMRSAANPPLVISTRSLQCTFWFDSD